MKIKQVTVREEKGSVAHEGAIVYEVHLASGISASSKVLVESLRHKQATEELNVAAIVENIKHAICPFFEGKFIDIVECDILLEEIYRADKSLLISPVLIHALSVALSDVQSRAENIESFELFADLSQNETITIPYPFFQITDNQSFDKKFPVQKIFLLPLGASSFRHSLGSFEEIQKNLKDRFLFSSYSSVDQVLKDVDTFLVETKLKDVFVIGIQGNAEALYNNENGTYRWLNEDKNSEELLSIYKTFIENYGVFSIQDCFAEQDILGARTLLEIFGDRVQLVSDKLLAVDDLPALENLKSQANALIIRPDDYLTVTKVLTHVMQVKEQGINVIIAQRFPTNPSFFVDFAVGTSAGQIKTCEDHQQLFDRLLDIEDTMTFSLLSFK